MNPPRFVFLRQEEIAFMNYSKEILARAKEIHSRVLTMDSHIDIQLHNFTSKINYRQELNTQVNLPFMNQGDLNIAWLVVYTRQLELNDDGYQKAYEDAMHKFKAIHRLCKEFAPDQIGLAGNSAEARAIHQQGKRVVMIAIENGYPIGTDISRVKEFYDLGGRYMSFSHNGHSQLCDSHTGEADGVWLHNGLSDLGKEVVAEMNKWGIMIDVSHPSKASMRDLIKYSKAPIIASHSSARALCGHSRNLDDEQLQWIKDCGGVVQTVAFSAYLNTEKHNAYTKVVDREIEKLGFKVIPRAELEQMGSNAMMQYRLQYRDLSNEVAEIARTQAAPVDIQDFVDHIDYMVHKMGLDHVGISSDFDGGGGVYGWNDASETFNVTTELVKRGYTESQIAQLWGGNLLRVLDAVEKVAKEIQSQKTE